MFAGVGVVMLKFPLCVAADSVVYYCSAAADATSYSLRLYYFGLGGLSLPCCHDSVGVLR